MEHATKDDILKYVISKLDIFPLICATDKVWVTELTWFHKNIRSVRNSNGQELNLILKINSQCDVKHISTSLIKTITPVLKILTYIITSIAAHPVGFAEIVVLMSVSTFKTAVILYISNRDYIGNHLSLFIPRQTLKL